MTRALVSKARVTLKRDRALPKVLIIYTGGTFGMDAQFAIDPVLEIRRGSRGFQNSKNSRVESLHLSTLNPEKLKRRFLDRVPELSELAQCEVDIAFNRDSAHMGPSEWQDLATRIREKAGLFDGIVLLHGTDTLPYTACALSFLLIPCPKPIVITGAQRPLAALRTDARRNLVSAVEIAAHGPRSAVSRVNVFFDDRLLQGNRTRKRSASEFGAFESPQCPPLALVGTSIRYLGVTHSKPLTAKLPHLLPRFEARIALMHVTPGFPSRVVRESLLKELSALILTIFPSGTAPTHDTEFLLLLREAKSREIPVILVTEGADPGSGEGANPANYAAGRQLLDEGGIWAGAMTPECAYVKASLLLGQFQGKKMFDRFFSHDLADEGSEC